MNDTTEKDIPLRGVVKVGKLAMQKIEEGLYCFRIGGFPCFDYPRSFCENPVWEKHGCNIWAYSDIRKRAKDYATKRIDEELLYNFEEITLETVSGKNKITKTKDKFFLPSTKDVEKDWWCKTFDNKFGWKKKYFIMLREGKGDGKIGYWDRDTQKVKYGEAYCRNKDVYLLCRIKENTKFSCNEHGIGMIETPENIPGIEMKELKEFLSK